jgi:hypothetical protein
MLAAVATFAIGIAGTAHAENQQSPNNPSQPACSGAMADVTSKIPIEVGSSTSSLTALLAEWDRAAFSPPSRPSQYRVYGRNGYVTSGPGYNAMVSLIRSAVKDSREGRDREAAPKIASARHLLAASKARQG